MKVDDQTYLFGLIDSKFKATAEYIHKGADQVVQHSYKGGDSFHTLQGIILSINHSHQHVYCTCRGEDASDDAAYTYEELPQRHVLFRYSDHERAEVILHKNSRDAMASCGMVNHPLLQQHNQTAVYLTWFKLHYKPSCHCLAASKASCKQGRQNALCSAHGFFHSPQEQMPHLFRNLSMLTLTALYF